MPVRVAVVGDASADPPGLVTAITRQGPVGPADSRVSTAVVSVECDGAPPGTDGRLELELTVCGTPKALDEYGPQLVLILFGPASPESFEAAKEWSKEVDRQVPRPRVCVCASRVEALARRRAATSHMASVSVSDGLSFAASVRAASYTEVSATSNTNLTALLRGLAKASRAEADIRPTQEVAESQRADCMQAAGHETLWKARRDPVSTRVYFINSETHSTQWTLPKDFDGTLPPLVSDAERHAYAPKTIDQRQLRSKAERAAAAARHEASQAAANRLKDSNTVRDVLCAKIAALEQRLDRLHHQRDEQSARLTALRAEEAELPEASVYATRSVPTATAEIDRSLEEAKGRVFQLQARLDFTDPQQPVVGPIAERTVTVTALQQRMQDEFERQKDVQREVTRLRERAHDAKVAVDDRRLRLMTLQQRLAQLRRESKGAVPSSGTPAANHTALAALRTEVERLREVEAQRDAKAGDRVVHFRRLLEACAQLDGRISTLRERLSHPVDGSGVEGSDRLDSSRGRQTPRRDAKLHTERVEVQRLRHEQRSMAERLAVDEADATKAELALRTALIRLQHAITERDDSFAKRMSTGRSVLQASALEAAVFDANQGLDEGSRTGLLRIAFRDMAKGNASSDVTTEQQQDLSTARALERSYRTMERDGLALSQSHAANEAAVKGFWRQMEEESDRQRDVSQTVVATFDGLSVPPTLSRATANMDRLRKALHDAVGGDLEAIERFTNAYSAAVVAVVDLPPAVAERGNTTVAAPSTSRLGGGRRQAKTEKASYDRLVQRMSRHISRTSSSASHEAPPPSRSRSFRL